LGDELVPTLDSNSEHKVWCSSRETKKSLKISDCELMHMRLSNQLEFKKIGNAFFYLLTKDQINSQTG
jgi:hypothetical protein